MTKATTLTDEQAAAKGLVPYYNGYYRESAKYKTEWMFIEGDCSRRIVSRALNKLIKSDRNNHYYGSRIKIVKVHTRPDNISC